MENKLTQAHIDLIHKIINAKLTKIELAEVRAEAEKIKARRSQSAVPRFEMM